MRDIKIDIIRGTIADQLREQELSDIEIIDVMDRLIVDSINKSNQSYKIGMSFGNNSRTPSK